MMTFAFLMEQALGHVTHHQNLAQWVNEDAMVRPVWLPVSENGSGRWNRVPGVRSNWSLKSSLQARARLQEAAETHHFDALFFHTQTISLFALDWMRRVPTVISIDSTPKGFDSLAAAYDHVAAKDTWRDRLKFRWNQRTFEVCAALISFSEWAKLSLIKDYGIPPSKITVIPPGVDLLKWDFANQRQSKQAQRQLRLLFVGGDFARKGGRELIEAYRNGLQRDCRLDIVTKDAQAAGELQAIQGVQFHLGLSPNSSELRRLYAEADVFVFPTRGDCSPIAVVEAMAAGLPVIATRVGGVPEMLEDGINGFTVPLNDVAAIGSAVRALLTDPVHTRQMAHASRKIVERRFNASRNFGEVLSLLKHVAQDQRTS